MALDVATVTRLIAKHGRSASHVVSSTTPVDPAKEWDGNTATETVTTVDAVFLDFTLRDIDGSSVLKEGDQRVLISGAVANIEDGHIIRDGVADWRIVKTDIIEPGVTRFLYDLVVRK